MNELWSYLANNGDQLAAWTWPTVWLAVVPLAAGVAIALPVGWLAFRRRWIAGPIVPVTRILYTVPSVVMFLVLPDLLGTRILDPLNVAVALTLYTLALMIPTVVDGFASVPGAILDAATAMGQSPLQRLRAVQLPLALPVISAGTRVAAVSNVSLISVASIIGTAQLGQLFISGANLGSLAAIVLGLIVFLLLALALDAVILLITRLLTPWRTAAAA